MTNPTNPTPPWVAGAAQHGEGSTQEAPGAVPVAAGAAEQPTAGERRPNGLALAGAGSLLAVLAFLGGTAVGHAWNGSDSTTPTQFNGPGGGRFGPNQGTQPGQDTQPGQGMQPGQGVNPGAQPSQAPGQTRTS